MLRSTGRASNFLLQLRYAASPHCAGSSLVITRYVSLQIEFPKTFSDQKALEHSFSQAVLRLNEIWADLHFPMDERRFFMREHCQRATQKHFAEVLSQYNRLLLYRRQIKELVDAIQHREGILKLVVEHYKCVSPCGLWVMQ